MPNNQDNELLTLTTTNPNLMTLFAIKKAVKYGALICFLFLVLISFSQTKEWKVPKKFKRYSNPYAGNTEDLFIGRGAYKKHCYSCHGGSGIGNGPKASNLKSKLTSFRKSEFQSQADGVLYYKIMFGKDEMPAFEKVITEDEDLWHLINYIRTFKN